MSKSMVIVVSASGEVQAMHREDVMTLEFLGPRTITRATDIRFNSATQKWGIWPNFSGHFLPPFPSTDGFSSYEKARIFEVLWVEECLSLGVPPGQSASESVAVVMRADFDQAQAIDS